VDLVQIIINGLVAAGTIAVAIVAGCASRTAGSIAKADRDAAIERDTAERSYDTIRHSLDHLVAIAEALEARDLLASAADRTEGNKAGGVLRARVNASPVRLPALEAFVSGEQPASLAVVNDIWQNYRDLLPPKIRSGTAAEVHSQPGLAARAELYGRIRDLRTELLAAGGDQRS
jgi:hypothetical protein